MKRLQLWRGCHIKSVHHLAVRSYLLFWLPMKFIANRIPRMFEVNTSPSYWSDPIAPWMHVKPEGFLTKFLLRLNLRVSVDLR